MCFEAGEAEEVDDVLAARDDDAVDDDDALTSAAAAVVDDAVDEHELDAWWRDAEPFDATDVTSLTSHTVFDVSVFSAFDFSDRKSVV